MNNEVNTNLQLEKYKYQLERIGEPRITVIDDNIMGYRTTNPTYYDDMGHCGEPASGSFDVLVDAAGGTAFDRQYSMCA